MEEHPLESAPVDAIVAAFKTQAIAEQVARQIKQSGKDKTIKLHDVAVVWRDADGKFHQKDPSDTGAVKGLLGGLGVGAVIGVFAAPLFLPLVAAGAIVGGLAAKLHDGGIADSQLKQIGEALEKGAAAVIALVDPASSEAVNKMITDAGAEVVSIGLNEDTIAKLVESQSSQPDSGSASV